MLIPTYNIYKHNKHNYTHSYRYKSTSQSKTFPSAQRYFLLQKVFSSTIFQMGTSLVFPGKMNAIIVQRLINPLITLVSTFWLVICLGYFSYYYLGRTAARGNKQAHVINPVIDGKVEEN